MSQYIMNNYICILFVFFNLKNNFFAFSCVLILYVLIYGNSGSVRLIGENITCVV